MSFELQPSISSELISLRPLSQADFDQLFNIASDPMIWEQHPNPDRYKKTVFTEFFKAAMDSKGALLITDTRTGSAIGCSRYYELDEKNKSVAIGFTFIGRKYWGSEYNKAIKTAMLDHAFKFVATVFFHVGSTNIRSQKAVEKLAATKVAEKEIAFNGQPAKLNFVYELGSKTWAKTKA